MKRRPHPRHQRGVALLEVGVAMVLLSVSFLAVALSLAGAARSQRSGQAMVRAAVLAGELAEVMRANRAALEGSGPDRGFVLARPYAELTELSALPVPRCGGRYARPPNIVLDTPACTSAKAFADYATADWLTQVQTSLAGGAGSIVDSGGVSRASWWPGWSRPRTAKAQPPRR